MRNILLNLATSLDMLIEGPHGEYDWCFTDQDYGMKHFLRRVDTIFVGRKCYELMLRMGDQNSFPNVRHYVFSNTLTEVDSRFTLITGDIETQVRALKDAPGEDIWLFGGAGLTASLVNLGLVDELMVSVHPLVLGQGKPLFAGIAGRVHLTLKGTQTYSSGLVQLVYTLDPKSD